ncbi:3-oxoacyl-ACP synthase III family protein [Flavobacterium aciduliphilum]|uniref:3-oxoacyl-[acyl-carrier-protein] synthase-3 n=1 Tax=Flavobacterium aciduliphilum TaxID=1101402 RepID=A0A328YJ49_9FLAO|nr:ketoacyl-ACP synthase III [Flavobacterium aciduliphilum]RAR70236.1 3-oxoacyl-[acyl-carrier-protein] synthase-3 [Flavobacterium aciduliphilum]
MALITFDKVKISGLAACVPKNTIYNLNYSTLFDKESVSEIVEKTGIYERRFAPEGMCASDLCYHAAEKLIDDLNIDKSEIDLLVFVSQTPDYRMPATSIVLQERLGLSKSTACFDINLGCSAFVYGLSVIYSMMQTGGFRKALLLDGETRSRVYSPKDRKTAFLFGDGGVAALIEKSNEVGKSFFSLNSDGSKSEYIKMDAGGYRFPSSVETLKEKVVDEYGNIRSDEHGYMNGADVFNFVISEIPKDIKRILAYSESELEQFDYFFFHQANKYMNGYLQKKLKLDSDKVPSCIEKFGNTSSVSIPLTMVSSLFGKNYKNKNCFLSGFGVGMSWASCIINLYDCHVSELIEI